MTEQPTVPGAPPPVARIDPAPSWTPVWLVPIAAALVAGILGWQAWGARGTAITLQLADGHGLKPGDTLRHRGTVAGEVTDVTYASDLAGVRATVVLAPDASDLARVGSRFWVVRPHLGWAGVTGLDTLVGDSYLAVIPGGGPVQNHFVGLPEAPIADALVPGLDITLEGQTRGSLRPGSPVTYRRIHVGSVLAVSLASDGRSVDASVRIRQEYAALVQEDSRFWETSGLTLDVGITGASFHLDSLESLVSGGVSLATPDGSGSRVSTGHRFELHAGPQSAWLDWRPSVPIGHSLLPAGAPVPHPRRAALTWKEGRLWTGTERREGWVLVLPDALLGPGDLMRIEEDADEDTTVLEVAGTSLPLVGEPEQPAPGLALRPMPAGVTLSPWRRNLQRAPDGPEDCLLVADPGSAPLSLAPGRFETDADGWKIDSALPVDDRWHGAPVVARSDGMLIGMVFVNGSGAKVIPLPRPLP